MARETILFLGSQAQVVAMGISKQGLDKKSCKISLREIARSIPNLRSVDFTGIVFVT